MKKNEKRVKNKYGVYKGNTISQETIGEQKSLIITEKTGQDFTIEKDGKVNLRDNVIVIDEQKLLNKKRKSKTSIIVKILVGVLVAFIAMGVLAMVIVKYV